MSRCELSGKSVVVKNKVSHSNIKTKSRAWPNVQKKRLFSPTLNQFVCLKVATSTLKSMEHSGGFDQYILNLSQETMSKRAFAVRQRIKRKITTPGTKKAAAAPVKEAAPAAAKKKAAPKAKGEAKAKADAPAKAESKGTES